MTNAELIEILNEIQYVGAESSVLEIKAAELGCPKHLYDTLSSFSNQDEGGTIIFGVDEKRGFEEVGVYDPQDLQKKVNEQCLQMEPVVRPLMTVVERNGRSFVAAEIPGADIVDRPVFYKGKGRLKGSYVRVGDSDEPMTEYEVYSYEAYRRKYQDDIRPVERAAMAVLDQDQLQQYLYLLRKGKPNLSRMGNESIMELMSITRDHKVTMAAAMLFCPFPQAYFPQLCITAVSVPGRELGDVGEQGERFIDNKRIEGSIPEMLEEAIRFVTNNMKRKTIIDPNTGKRNDKTDYPILAVREAVLNALVHRDYSIHTEGMPIQLLMFEDRMEIRSPGGLYGRIRADQLGKVQPDTRNPVLVSALEVLGITENRYSGIPTIRREIKEYNMAPPVFEDMRGTFVVTFYKMGSEPKMDHREYRYDFDFKPTGIGGVAEEIVAYRAAGSPIDHIDRMREDQQPLTEEQRELIRFCRIPRTRKEVCDHLGLSSLTYGIQTHVMPLVRSGHIRMSIPDKPGSPRQRFCSSSSAAYGAEEAGSLRDQR